MDIKLFFQLFPMFFIFGGIMLIVELVLVTATIGLLHELKLTKIDPMTFYYGKLPPKLLLLFLIITLLNAVASYYLTPIVGPLLESICPYGCSTL